MGHPLAQGRIVEDVEVVEAVEFVAYTLRQGVLLAHLVEDGEQGKRFLLREVDGLKKAFQVRGLPVDAITPPRLLHDKPPITETLQVVIEHAAGDGKPPAKGLHVIMPVLGKQQEQVKFPFQFIVSHRLRSRGKVLESLKGRNSCGDRA